MRPLNRFAAGEDGPFEFTALDLSGTNVIVNGKVLWLSDIDRMVQAIVKESQEIVCRELCFGLTIGEEGWNPGLVHEEPRQISASYSCFTDPQNSYFTDHKDTLLHAVFTQPTLRGRFYFIDGNGDIVWKPGACLEYLNLCQYLELLLCAGAQLTVGEPARGTELASHLIANVSGGDIRNIFVIFQRLCMMGTYNKTSHLRGHGIKMMRIPHPELGEVWMRYLARVRPFVSVLQRHLHGPAAAVRAKHLLFFGLHRPITSTDISDALSRHTERLLGIKIRIGLWRHLVTYLLNLNGIALANHLASPSRAAQSAQMGHSEKTHRLYAGDSRLPSQIDLHTCIQTMRLSTAWHRLIGYKGPCPFDRVGPQRSLEPCTVASLASQTEALDFVLSDLGDVIVEQLLQKALPEFVRIYSQTRANDLATLIHATGLGRNVNETYHEKDRRSSGSVTQLVHPSRLYYLRQLIADPNASFQDAEEALAVELIAQKAPCVLFITTTGKFCKSRPFDSC